VFILVVLASLALVVLAIWRGGLTWRFVAARLALLRAARANPDVTIERGLLFGPRFSITRGAHRIQCTPMSLGFLRDDPPWTWWWITAKADVKVFVRLHLARRRPDRSRPTIPSQKLLDSGDDDFDARHVAYSYDPDESERASAMILLRDAEVQRVVRELIVADTDDCALGSHLYVSRRREGLELDDMLAELRRAARLCDAVERAFNRTPYRE
jgi:hypothetical protein